MNNIEWCSRCGRAVFPNINAGVCGCELHRYYVSDWGQTEEDWKSFYARANYPADVLKELARHLCAEEPEMYSQFIDSGVTIFLNVDGVWKSYEVKGEQEVVFYVDSND